MRKYKDVIKINFREICCVDVGSLKCGEFLA
jgi:hypothetical protein